MKKYIFGLIMLAALLLCFTADAGKKPQSVPSVTVTNMSYDRVTGDFTLYVAANRPWEVWGTVDFVTWVKVSGNIPPSQYMWTDASIGTVLPYRFYIVRVASGFPRGHHYGWIQHRDFTWYWWYDNGPFADRREEFVD